MTIDYQTIGTVIGVLLGGGTIGVIVTTLANRKKINAEAKNIQVSGEISISESAMKYANSLRKDVEILKGQIQRLQQQVSDLIDENIDLKKKMADTEIVMHQLEAENKKLRKKLSMRSS